MVIPLRHQLVYTDDGSLDDLAELDPDPLPGRSAPLAGRLRGQRRRPHRDLGGRPGADRRRAPHRGRQPAPIARAQPAGRAGRRRGRGVRGPVRRHRPDRRAPRRPRPRPSRPPTRDHAGSPLDLDELDPVVQAAAQAARAWLARLGEAMRPEDQVLALPYGDVDVAAAAAHGPQLYQRAVARAGTTLPGFDVTTTPVLSSPSGYLSEQAIDAAAPGSTILLTDAMFDAPAPGARQHRGSRRGRRLDRGAAEGGPGPDSRTSVTAMRQRLLAEAAVRFLRGDRAPLTMVIPHDWNPSDGSGCVLQRPRRGLARPHLGAASEPGGRTHQRGRRDPALPRSGRRPPSSTSRTSTRRTS